MYQIFITDGEGEFIPSGHEYITYEAAILDKPHFEEMAEIFIKIGNTWQCVNPDGDTDYIHDPKKYELDYVEYEPNDDPDADLWEQEMSRAEEEHAEAQLERDRYFQMMEELQEGEDQLNRVDIL